MITNPTIQSSRHKNKKNYSQISGKRLQSLNLDMRVHLIKVEGGSTCLINNEVPRHCISNNKKETTYSDIHNSFRCHVHSLTTYLNRDLNISINKSLFFSEAVKFLSNNSISFPNQ